MACGSLRHQAGNKYEAVVLNMAKRARESAPLSTLLKQISRLGTTTLEPHVANAVLLPLLVEVFAVYAELGTQLQQVGWQDGKFSSTVDLHALAHLVQKQRFEKLEELGKGSYGTVYRAKDRETNQTVALKKLKCDAGEGLPSTTIREISLLRDLQHDNIVQVKDVAWAFGDSHLYVVLECLDCDLATYLSSQKEKPAILQVKVFLQQILKAMWYAHSNSVMHRDLKPQNILIDKASQKLKVADFGLARTFLPPYKAYSNKVVTLFYRAPELLLGAPHYSCAIDMWSVGCIFAELVLGEPLFRADSEIGVLFKIFETLGTPTSQTWADVTQFAHYSPEYPKWQVQQLHKAVPGLANDPVALDLLHSLLTYDPRNRLTARMALQHPWFQDVNSART